MKTRSKLIVALSSLLAVTAGAAATSTFAWFTSTRTATVTFTQATAYSDNGDLTVKYINPAETEVFNACSVSDYASTLPITNTTSYGLMTDISGNGVTFYKPTMTPDATDANQKFVNGTAPIVVNSSTKQYYVEFGLEFKNNNTSGNVSVYYNNNSKVEAGAGSDATANSDVILASRIAFLTRTGTAGSYVYTLVGYWNPNSDTNPVYMNSATVASNSISTAPCDGGTPLTNYLAGTPVTVTKADDTGASKQLLLSNIAAAGTAQIFVRMWLEGTSSKCINAAKAGTAKLTLGFSGI